MTTAVCIGRMTDSSYVINGFVSGVDRNHIYYGSFDFDTSLFDVWSTFNIIEIGNLNQLKYSVLPLTYDSYNDLIYLASADVENNQSKLCVIAATNGALVATFNQIQQPIISLQFDNFQRKLFAHVEIHQSQSLIIEIDTNNGTIKRVIGTLNSLNATALSSYSPVSEEYFLMMIENEQYIFIAFNTNNVSDSKRTSLDFIPLNMRCDYKTSTIYITYIDQPDRFISSIGTLNQTTGHIDNYLGIVSRSTNLHLTAVSAYDMAQDIYYTSTVSNPLNSTGIIYIDTYRQEIQSRNLPNNITKTHGWFIKQFG